MRSRSGLAGCAIAAALLLTALLPAGASAQFSRTYVDRANGNDANDCLRETPCLTFQRAHDQTLPNGEVNALTPGNYSSLVINRPITIDGGGTQATLTPSGTAITVNLPSAGKVTLRNLNINVSANQGAYGLEIGSAGTVTLDDVVINGGTQAGIRARNENGLLRLFVNQSDIRGNSGAGILLAPPGANITRAVITNSQVADHGGPGLKLQPTAGGSARATVRRSDFDVNFNGMVAESAGGGTAILNVFSSAITDSGRAPADPGVGIYSSGSGSTVRLSRNEIQHNKRGLQAVAGGSILSTGDNDIFGNGIDGVPTGTLTRG